MRRFYLELYSANYSGENDYLAQTKWVDSLIEVEKLYVKIINFVADTFDFIEDRANSFFAIMYADFDEDNNYGDIDQFGTISMENGKVVIKAR